MSLRLLSLVILVVDVLIILLLLILWLMIGLVSDWPIVLSVLKIGNLATSLVKLVSELLALFNEALVDLGELVDFVYQFIAFLVLNRLHRNHLFRTLEERI